MTRFTLASLVAMALMAIVSPAFAGITVTEYSTVALTNGYAPTSQTQYFAQETLTNISHADAHVSGDWVGPNANGTPNTWHFVGSSRATSNTTISATSYGAAASTSFEYVLDTTTEFVDPASSTVYGPGGAGSYRGFFEIDQLAMYIVDVTLNQHAAVSLGSFEAGFLFSIFNPNPTPLRVERTGAISTGHYQILAAAGVAAPNLPNGAHHLVRSGGFENFVFNVQIPEPTGLVGLTALVLTYSRRNQRVSASLETIRRPAVRAGLGNSQPL